MDVLQNCNDKKQLDDFCKKLCNVFIDVGKTSMVYKVDISYSSHNHQDRKNTDSSVQVIVYAVIL